MFTTKVSSVRLRMVVAAELSRDAVLALALGKVVMVFLGAFFPTRLTFQLWGRKSGVCKEARIAWKMLCEISMDSAQVTLRAFSVEALETPH